MISKVTIYMLTVLTTFSCFSQSQPGNQVKCSPMTLEYLAWTSQMNSKNDNRQQYVYKKIAGKVYLSALVKMKAKSDFAHVFATLGIIAGTKAGNIFTIQIPEENLATVMHCTAIDYLQLDEPVYINLDSARSDTRVDSVHSGINLPQAYSGRNVVVGVIDAGLDYTHPTLLDTTGTKLRLKKVWEQKSTGTPPSGYIYGNEISDSAALYNDGSDVAAFSHGTHVTGIAGGSGNGSPNGQYRGIAYGSELVFVGIKPDPDQWTTTGLSNIIDGVNYIFSYASLVGKPAVVNLSWGCSMGPHDGTSLFSEALDSLTGPGKIFVCAAGNNGGDNIHLYKKFTSTDTLVRSNITFSSYNTEKRNWIDVWGDAGKTYCAKITLYNGGIAGNNTGFVCDDGMLHDFTLIGSGGDSCFIKITNTGADFNGRPRIFLNIFSKTSNRVEISIKGTDGNIHAWMGFVKDYTGYYGSFSMMIAGQSIGNKDITISDIASTHSAISAAAYASKNSYTNLDGQLISYTTYVTQGNLAPFSSHGPAADSLTKPDIAAPGLVLASGINSFDTTYQAGGTNRSDVVTSYLSPVDGRTYNYAMMMGTSMASPMTSGIIALMLEANPALSPSLVLGILKETAIQDNFTGNIPATGSPLWGYGKINAYGAVKKTIESVGVASFSNDATHDVIYPNPASGNITVELHANKESIATVKIYDLSGKCCFQCPWKIEKGKNVRTFTLSLARGMYVVKTLTTERTSCYKLIEE
jgi:minor extracellular serine protease Vpr